MPRWPRGPHDQQAHAATHRRRADAGLPPTPRHALVEWARTRDRFGAAVVGVAVVQAGWLAVLTSRGWYYQADFSNLAQATGRPLTWSYLTLPQGGHLSAFSRLVFWILNRVGALEYAATNLVRVVVQAACTVAIGRLLALLVGRRRAVVVVLALYAVNPVLLQGTTWLTASISALGSQVFLLAAINAHVRYALTRQWRWAALTGLGAFAATVCSEQAAVTVLILPILSIAFLHDGSWRQRLGATIGEWRAWLCVGVPIMGFLAYFFLGGTYGDQAAPITLHQAWTLIWVEWTSTLLPMIAGGPWHWYANTGQYLPAADPGVTARLAGAALAAGLLALGWSRTSWRAAAAWLMPTLVSSVGILIVGSGRFESLGVLIAKLPEHTYYTALPLLLAVCLSLWADSPAAIRGRLSATTIPASTATTRAARRHLVPARVAAVVLLVAVALGCGYSGVRYTRIWAASPAHDYVRTLLAALHRAGPTATVYDSPLPDLIVPGIAADHYLSDLTGLAEVPITYDHAAPRPPVIAAATGVLAPASFYRSASAAPSAGDRCGQLIRGVTTRRIPLLQTPPRGNYYLRLGFFQERPSSLDVTVLSAAGRVQAPVHGAHVEIGLRLGWLALRLPPVDPSAVIVTSRSAATNICLVTVEVGDPHVSTAR